MYYLFMPSLEERQGLISFLKERGILSVFHYVPLHLSPMGRRMGGGNAQCTVTEEVSDRLLRLPFYNSLEEAEQNQVINAILEFGKPERSEVRSRRSDSSFHAGRVPAVIRSESTVATK